MLFFGTVACTTTASRSTVDSAAEGGAGYFVALAASPDAPAAMALHDALYDAIDAYNRRHAGSPELLARYVEAFEADGLTRLGDQTSEIECDRQKCLLKLAGRSISTPLAQHLADAFIIKGIEPKKALGKGERTSTYTLGNANGLHITCAAIESAGGEMSHRCDFALDGKAAGKAASAALSGPSAKGKLVDCEQAPGVVRSANEAKGEIDGGDLLRLTSGTGAAAGAVGFLRLTRQKDQVEFLDLYLCGDLSHDYFKVDGAARRPQGWLPKPAAVGSPAKQVETLTQEEARLDSTAVVVAVSETRRTLEVRFRVKRLSDSGPEAFGEDKFYVQFDKSWLD
jgi:hypothetical protein